MRGNPHVRFLGGSVTSDGILLPSRGALQRMEACEAHRAAGGTAAPCHPPGSDCLQRRSLIRGPHGGESTYPRALHVPLRHATAARFPVLVTCVPLFTGSET